MYTWMKKLVEHMESQGLRYESSSNDGNWNLFSKADGTNIIVARVNNKIVVQYALYTNYATFAIETCEYDSFGQIDFSLLSKPTQRQGNCTIAQMQEFLRSSPFTAHESKKILARFSKKAQASWADFAQECAWAALSIRSLTRKLDAFQFAGNIMFV